MASFLLRRLVNHAVLVVVAASLAYLLAAAALKPRANFEDRTPRPPAAVVEAELTRLNLNDRTPLADRYRVWATGVLHGDFGRTWQGSPVNDELWRRLQVSLRLLVLGAVAGFALGVLLGAWAAMKRHRMPDRLITLGSYLLLAVPVFVLAMLLQTAAKQVNDVTGLQVFEWVGESSPGAADGTFGALGGLGDRVRHLLLPTATIALAQLALYSRYQRSMMLDVLDADFVRTARAKGLRRRDALLRHGLRTALIPMCTYFAYTSGLLLLGAMFTEKVFGWHGLGEWLIDSITRGDANVVAAVDCFAAVAVLLAGLVSDVLYGVLDPRVRVGAR
ncbi:ABC transporter permease [Actinomadura macrotermitis]|uniref:Putative peptide transport permease protein n=1 Tax=Actinomadura macrotermitis TaxID=2585200 RepID=A0A7K0BNM5_9ACTN|nr:ABC transporter permease [Actinomadura macrotermitis]MQY02771.1 putative peptide transport permease protein [Actinomadura macrotermitis]